MMENLIFPLKALTFPFACVCDRLLFTTHTHDIVYMTPSFAFLSMLIGLFYDIQSGMAIKSK